MARLFALNSPRKPPESVGNLYPAIVFLLERDNPRSLLDFTEIAERFHLTQRETEALQLLTEGLATKEIAARMQISPHTVKAFFRLVMSKMRVASRAEIFARMLLMNH